MSTTMFRKYQLGNYEEMCAAHRWEVPERYNIARDVCDKHDRDRLAMVWEDWRGNERRSPSASCRTSPTGSPTCCARRRGARRPGGHAAALAARDRGRLPRHLQGAARSCSRCRCCTATTRSSTGSTTPGPRCWSPRPPTATGWTACSTRRSVLVAGAAGAESFEELTGALRPASRPRPHDPDDPGPALLHLGHDRDGQGHPARPPLPARRTRSSSSATTSGPASCSTARASGPGSPGSCPASSGPGASGWRRWSRRARAASTPRRCG